MIVARDSETLNAALKAWRQAGQTVAFVPTMGNLHDGHLSLVDEARDQADHVVASIFVNPTQFGPDEDFDKYPRTPQEDLSALRVRGCDLAWLPDVDTIYPHGTENGVRLKAPEDLASPLEGAHRPGHFDGVLTVVCRLFNHVRPDVAVFGEKDYQQLLLIRRMVVDLGMPIKVVSVATVREPDGLAMSSRNRYLEVTQRGAASVIYQALTAAGERIRKGECDFPAIEAKLRETLEKTGMKVDYAAIRRDSDLSVPTDRGEPLRILVAAWQGGTRLIDNKLL